MLGRDVQILSLWIWFKISLNIGAVGQLNVYILLDVSLCAMSRIPIGHVFPPSPSSYCFIPEVIFLYDRFKSLHMLNDHKV